jgi:hypothetical protein
MMMSKTVNSVKEITLAPVPRTTFAEPNVTANMSKYPWSARFNVACWLRVEHAVQSPIQVKLVYKDSRGWRQVRVDGGFINSRNRILLSGAVEIHALGPILEMKVNATGISSVMKTHAEELFVQRIEESGQQKNLPAEAA